MSHGTELGLHSESDTGTMSFLLGLAHSPRPLLALCQTAADRTGLLLAEIQRLVFVVLVKLTQSLPLLLANHGEDSGDRLADNLAGD